MNDIEIPVAPDLIGIIKEGQQRTVIDKPPRRNEVTKNKNVNSCEDPEEDPEVFDPEDHGINLVEDFTDDDDFGRILLE